MSDDAFARSVSDDEQREILEQAKDKKDCEICAVPIREMYEALIVSVNKGQTTLVFCRPCAVGMVASLLSVFDREEIQKTVNLAKKITDSL